MNTQTFSIGYTNYHSNLIGLAFSILRNTEEAEDVVSSVFTHAFENKHKIDPKTFENLMVISVRNKCLDALRSGWIKNVRYFPILDENFFVEKETHPDENLVVYNLRKAIDELPPIQRKLIILKYLEEMDRKTISQICKSNEHTIRNNLALGLKNLRKKISK
jgi:RNA polymerase sigma-70 factor (ECF subfamily)